MAFTLNVRLTNRLMRSFRMKFISVTLLSLFVTLSAFSKDYTLPYKKENRWVSKEDAADLRALIRDAKKAKTMHFYAQLPEDKRNVSIERLIVLRDILERQMKIGIIIEEIDSTDKKNHIIIHTKKPE